MPEVRAAAARCLQAVANGHSLARELPRWEQKVKFEQRPLLRELCYGTLRFYPLLDAVVRQSIKKPMKDKDSDLHMLLCLGIYQLDYMRIADHAAINTTVNAVRKLKKDWAKGLTNAVLRRFQRERETLLAALDEAEKTAHPAWLHQAILEAWPEQAEAIFAANNSHPPLCLRNNVLHQTRENYLEQLAGLDMEAKACAFAETGIRLAKPVDVSKLPDFDDGAVSVQDESAQLCAGLLQPQPGMRVLDACAAPGGKSGHLLEATGGNLNLTCLDIDDSRLVRVQDNLERLNLSAELIAGDAARPEQWWDKQPFDQILLDAPCSASGVVRRNPDIKLHRQSADIRALADTQLRLLKALWPTLKPGGRLLYATCSILPTENTEVVERFLAEEGSARHQPISADWGLAQPFGRQLLPQTDGHDGFYYAVLSKADV
ncbi:16S rRNA (cytosine967-C5)-methyltransferase [Litorivivens lipolytica]|uniref:16S rRNA (cytosine(967)-C(5))-methyltransferase n=1 Tax=Litorivivens lipolytica TaxID=1524264 RepID=A0A7W4Z6U1_9GAMM|nr:16S rRNA (cytosine(967)-C(5))-methyltransferase RsmB [Litorivivens lipolytica]MBB3048633.1 16S rRNA (cytosine967-C5)-methyltransferase [Litorivivens lipolytica]